MDGDFVSPREGAFYWYFLGWGKVPKEGSRCWLLRARTLGRGFAGTVRFP